MAQGYAERYGYSYMFYGCTHMKFKPFAVGHACLTDCDYVLYVDTDAFLVDRTGLDAISFASKRYASAILVLGLDHSGVIRDERGTSLYFGDFNTGFFTVNCRHPNASALFSDWLSLAQREEEDQVALGLMQRTLSYHAFIDWDVSYFAFGDRRLYEHFAGGNKGLMQKFVADWAANNPEST
eukprot:CAMPEP_0115714812 /NCGR_PEP_ID=MMETSP0272-20121206/75442_1 /TAXON_ID=71861 /ORGANISM="Scrippsiella trochoidea, Strain CCMP3099" /LENGTH=181 /DNA_ID=CAMNT_0003156989 /DNA_START=250 /DNA_END=791 /DNA_ORIENTATION=-